VDRIVHARRAGVRRIERRRLAGGGGAGLTWAARHVVGAGLSDNNAERYPRWSSGSARMSAQNTLNFDFGA
jgi:hypothetical protein